MFPEHTTRAQVRLPLQCYCSSKNLCSSQFSELSITTLQRCITDALGIKGRRQQETPARNLYNRKFVQLAYRLRGRPSVTIILLFYFWESLHKFSESCHLNQPNHTGSPSASTRSGQVRNTSFKQNPPTAILLTPDQHTPTGRDAKDFVSINTLHYSEVFIFKFNYRKMFQSD